MDIERIRKDFPILEKVIYMDNAATSLTPVSVIEEISEYYSEYRANVHRGIHTLSKIASERYEEAHEKISRLINSSPEEIILTSNTTQGINLIALSLDLRRGDKVVTTSLEHHSNLLPWMRLRRKGVKVEIVNPDRKGRLNIGDFEDVIDENTKLIAVTHISNVLGSISPVNEIGRIARENNILYLVDAAQSVPHIPVDVKEIKCDFLAFSGHKMLGPTGIGAIYIRKEIADELEPKILGGGTIGQVTLSNYTLTKSPERWEAGTPNIAGAIGFGKAVEYLQNIGFERIRRHERELTRSIVSGLREIENVEPYGPGEEYQIGIVSFNVKDLNPHEVASVLDKESGIMVRSGHHCAMPLMNLLGCPGGTVRASLYIYNTLEEVDRFISEIKRIAG